VIDGGYHIFLATDNAETFRVFQRRYGDKLLYYRKSADMPQRWPRQTSATSDIVEDLIDLWLLVSCEFVIGAQSSSFSRLAILLNGSPKCIALDRRLYIWRDRFCRIRTRFLPPSKRFPALPRRTPPNRK
jgi:hypothetical protein